MTSESIGMAIGKIVAALRSEMLEWQKENQTEMLELERDKSVTIQKIKEEIAIMEERFKERRRRIEMEERQQTQNFALFLLSIDETKSDILKNFAKMPKPLALLIHHQLTRLLTEAWHNNDSHERARYQLYFQELNMKIMEDLSDVSQGQSSSQLPSRSLEFINNLA